MIASVERQQPCGTAHGWTVSDQKWRKGGEETDRIGPIPCDKDPETHQHWLLTA